MLFEIAYQPYPLYPLPLDYNITLRVRRVKERRSLSYITLPPLLDKERGTEGVRLINNLRTR